MRDIIFVGSLFTKLVYSAHKVTLFYNMLLQKLTLFCIIAVFRYAFAEKGKQKEPFAPTKYIIMYA